MYERKEYGLRSDGHIFLPVTDTGIVWKVLIILNFCDISSQCSHTVDFLQFTVLLLLHFAMRVYFDILNQVAASQLSSNPTVLAQLIGPRSKPNQFWSKSIFSFQMKLTEFGTRGLMTISSTSNI